MKKLIVIFLLATYSLPAYSTMQKQNEAQPEQVLIESAITDSWVEQVMTGKRHKIALLVDGTELQPDFS